MIDWIKKILYVYTMEYYVVIKMNNIIHLCVQYSQYHIVSISRDIDETGSHHPQQANTETENQTPHVLTHRRVLNNENTWTQGEEHHALGAVGE